MATQWLWVLARGPIGIVVANLSHGQIAVERDYRRSLKNAKGIGLILPVHIAKGTRVRMQMVLGPLVVSEDLREVATVVVPLHIGWVFLVSAQAVSIEPTWLSAVEWCVQPEGAYIASGVERTQSRYKACTQSQRRMHRYRDADETCRGDSNLIERGQGQILRCRSIAGPFEKGQRQSKSMGSVADLV